MAGNGHCASHESKVVHQAENRYHCEGLILKSSGFSPRFTQSMRHVIFKFLEACKDTNHPGHRTYLQKRFSLAVAARCKSLQVETSHSLTCFEDQRRLERGEEREDFMPE